MADRAKELAKLKRYRERHKAELAVAHRQYGILHREELKAKARERYRKKRLALGYSPRRDGRNKEKNAAHKRARYQERREQILLQRKEERQRDPKKYQLANKAQKLKRIYGLEWDAFVAMMTAQDNKCAICRVDLEMVSLRTTIDHDHVTGAIRGILCASCNAGLGNLGDSIERLRLAIEYLKTYQ